MYLLTPPRVKIPLTFRNHGYNLRASIVIGQSDKDLNIGTSISFGRNIYSAEIAIYKRAI